MSDYNWTVILIFANIFYAYIAAVSDTLSWNWKYATGSLILIFSMEVIANYQYHNYNIKINKEMKK